MSRVLNGAGIERDIITIGASAGGVEAFTRLFRQFPPDLPATIAIVQHRSPKGNIGLGLVLCLRASLPCVEVLADTHWSPGSIFIASGDRHLVFEDGLLRPDRGPKVHGARPAIDPLFTSAARAFGPRVVGILLSGGGTDGTFGLQAIKQAGGVCLVQDPQEASVPFMPLSAITRDHVDAILTLDAMAEVIPALVRGKSIQLA